MIKYLLANPQVIVTVLLGSFTLIISWWFNRSNLKINHQKMEKELFSEFNRRYDLLNDSLSKLSGLNTIDDLKNTKSLIDQKSMYNVVIDYFNLCSEQYYWHEKKRISPEIWASWNAGMKIYYNNHAVLKILWKEEIKDNGHKSYYLKEDESFFEC
ncbi:hypothetical protein [Flavobacterium sp. GP15]|uniref:hypothetical protein n=1 Tax=Flavobacterium sp. GP15 TaxID=2758567 RepID=UPI00165D9BAE|nr:hypothetical protein [Flavobacterium sp. GP15]